MRKLIIDTDPGVDDAFAIAYAARHPEVDLLAVTTVFGNAALEHTSRNALRLLALCGRHDVPVAAGASRPLVHLDPAHAPTVHGTDGLSGQSHTLPEPKHGLDPRPAVSLLADTLEAADAPVDITPIGPLTNIALLLASRPDLKPKIGRIVVMGGGTEGGNVTAAAEFNVWADPEAAQRVLTEPGVRTAMAGLNVTLRSTVDTGWLAKLADSGPVGAALISLTPDYLAHYTHRLGTPAIAMHDSVAVAEAIAPGIVRTEPYAVTVDCSHGPGRGATVVDRRRGAAEIQRAEGLDPHTVDVAVEPDAESLRTQLMAVLAG